MRYQCRKAQGFKSLCEQTWSSVRVVKELASGASAETRKGSSPLVTKFLLRRHDSQREVEATAREPKPTGVVNVDDRPLRLGRDFFGFLLVPPSLSNTIKN